MRKFSKNWIVSTTANVFKGLSSKGTKFICFFSVGANYQRLTGSAYFGL